MHVQQWRSIHPLISLSTDGELIALVAQAFGLPPIRGSSSRRSIAALKELIKTVRSGHHLGMTPDGPRGPLREIQPGTLFLARKTGRPIVPMAYGARKKWIFRGWDEFLVPKPFNRIVVVFGEPIWVNLSDDMDEKKKVLKNSLDFVMKEADRVAGVGCA